MEMVIRLHFQYIAPFQSLPPITYVLLEVSIHTFTHIHTEAAIHLLRETNFPTTGHAIWSNLGSSILPKDTSKS